MDWFWFALISALCFTTYSILVRLTLKDEGDAQAFAPLSNVTVGIILFGVALFDQTFFRVQLWDYVLLAVSAVALAGASYLIIWGRQITPVSQISLVRQLSIAWTFIGGIFILSESVSVLKVLSILLIALGNGIVFLGGTGIETSKGITLSFFATFLVAMNALISKTLVENTISPALYSGIIQTTAAVLITIVLPDSLQREWEEIKTQKWKIVVVALSLAGSIYFLMRAYQVGEASRVAPVRSSAVLFVVLVGIVFLRERQSVWRKIVGAVVAFLGVVLLRM